MEGVYKTCSHCEYRMLRLKHDHVFAHCKLHDHELSEFTDKYMHCDDFKLNPGHTYIKQ